MPSPQPSEAAVEAILPADGIAEAVERIRRAVDPETLDEAVSDLIWAVYRAIREKAREVVTDSIAPALRAQVLEEVQEAVQALIRIQAHGALSENEQHMVDIAREALGSLPADLKADALATLTTEDSRG